MDQTRMAPVEDEQQAIREAANRKWEQAGRPIGNRLRFWLEAEAERHEQSSHVEITPLDIVQEAGEESFPASDAPSWMP
jgi:hypothetical protein